MLVDDDNVHIKLLKFKVALSKRLQKPIINRKTKRSNNNFENLPTEITSVESKAALIEPMHEKIPIVSLLIGGGIGSISLVLTQIYQGIPILVFKGTGHAPDLISGAYEDFADRYDNLSDNHLRTAITIRITEKFPKESKDDSTRNKIKDNLLQIIKNSHSQESGNLLTFIDSSSVNSELDDMDKYILIALLQSRIASFNFKYSNHFKSLLNF